MHLLLTQDYITFSNINEVMNNSFSTKNFTVLITANNFVFMIASFSPSKWFEPRCITVCIV